MSGGAGPAFFSADYAQARERFLAAASKRDAALDALAIDARGPRGEELAIDIAWLGDRQPRRTLLHACGIHGVEGFAGSAIQLAILGEPPDVPAGAALILVHGLNPWGMAWLRRVNENNVDLNRNFILGDEPRPPASGHYRRLDGLLNPASPPSADGFHVRAAARVLRHGLRPLTQAIAEGQYEFPRGLFFGGLRLEQGPALYAEWVRTRLAGVQRGFAIDVHTGLGRWGGESLFLREGSADARALSSQLNRALAVDGGTAGYRVRGGHGAAFERLSPPAFAFVTQEFGTYSGVRVLHALREENRWHHSGGGTLAHPARRRLLETFAPASPAWRQAAVERGLSLAHAAARLTFG